LGLTTDIGGILAHGSIVAREYGIPAVMGTGNATRRIVSGQLITVDGDAGTVSDFGVMADTRGPLKRAMWTSINTNDKITQLTSIAPGKF